MKTEMIDVNDGKYTVCIGDDGSLKALRYGEEWRSLTGDNLVYWLAVELREAREQIKDFILEARVASDRRE